MARLIGIDVGTSACKAVLANECGDIIAAATKPYPLLSPRPGWSEQNPDDWVTAARACLKELGEADCIGFTGQMHGAVFLDADYKPLRPAILWNDQRTVAEVEAMSAKLDDEIIEETLNPPLTGFQAPKIIWLRENEPENFSRTSMVLLPKDFVRLKLTGCLATDVSDASGTGLFNIAERRWSSRIISSLDIPHGLFPPYFESADMACEDGDYFPTAAGAGDQAAGAVAVGAVSPDVLSVSLGTSGVVFSAQDAPYYDAQGRVHTFCHANGKWHSMSVMLNCGGALKWAREVFSFSDFDEMAKLAKNAKPTAAQFKPYLSGERSPFNDSSLRASLSGLSFSDGKAEIARAVFEGVTAGLADGYEVLRELRKSEPDSLRVTGGGAKSDFWMQLIADTFNIPAVRVFADEGPAFGAALLAGVAWGVWPDVETACKSAVKLGETFVPKNA